MSKVYFGNLNKNSKEVAIIMAGGHGTRFWPISRVKRPKQFLPLGDSSRSLIQLTSDRLKGLINEDSIIVVTSGDQKELVSSHLPKSSVLVEPMGKNTAPCLGFAAIKVLKEVGDVPMICMPSDHLMKNKEKVLKVYKAALNLAKKREVLVTIGITPTSSHTGYGYLKKGEVLEAEKGSSIIPFKVKRFVEKPDKETAKKYLDSGKYFWNSGIFSFRPSVLLKAIESYLPDLRESLDKISGFFDKEDEFLNIRKEFFKIEKISIDYGIMEKALNVIMISAEDFGWSDVGSWGAWADLEDERKEEGSLNVKHSQKEVIFVNSKNCGVYAENRVVSVVGLEDVVVVETKDAVLVCNRKEAQKVKEVTNILKKRGMDDLL